LTSCLKHFKVYCKGVFKTLKTTGQAAQSSRGTFF
jgi:hypothetical protein